MTQRMYVIFDKVAKESGPVFEARNDGVALRKFKDFIQNNKNSIVEEVEFKLLFVGKIDHDTSIITAADEVIEVIANLDLEFEEKR